MMLFKLNSSGEAVLIKEAVKLCPELKSLSEKELLFVILTYDYYSKYHQFPEDERIRKAKFEIFGNEQFDENKKIIKLAIDAYKGLQFDVRRETLETYQSKISQLNSKILADDVDVKTMKDIMDTISKLQKHVMELKEEIDKDLTMMDLTGGKQLSWLEKMQQNLTAYKRFRK